MTYFIPVIDAVFAEIFPLPVDGLVSYSVHVFRALMDSSVWQVTAVSAVVLIGYEYELQNLFLADRFSCMYNV